MRDIQDVVLAEHTENYVKQRQREQTENPDSLSHEYNAAQSRQDAFQ